MSKVDNSIVEIAIEGDLLFSTVVAKQEAILNQLRSLSGSCRLVFYQVGRVDSSALSLWLCFKRYAESRSINLEVVNLPDDMLSIAKLVGIDEQLSQVSIH